MKKCLKKILLTHKVKIKMKRKKEKIDKAENE